MGQGNRCRLALAAVFAALTMLFGTTGGAQTALAAHEDLAAYALVVGIADYQMGRDADTVEGIAWST